MHLLLLIAILFLRTMIGSGFRHPLFRVRRNLAMASSSAAAHPLKNSAGSPLVVNVHLDKEILEWLKLQGHMRKARLLVSTKTCDWSLASLRALIENKFPTMLEQPYKLRYKASADTDCTAALKQFRDDVHLRSVMSDLVDRKESLQLFAQINPGIFPPTSTLPADPLESAAFTFVSFYVFSKIADPADLSLSLRSLWEQFKALGRVYIAKEGVNAQMAVPSNVFSSFMEATRTLPLFAEVRFNTDHEMTREDFLQHQPFRALHIRVRNQIVTDGFEEELDWSKAGKELLPLDWHQQISDPRSIVLDCRNTYETDVGRFQNAIPLNTTVFRESWDAMEELLADTPKDAPIYAYCTGGIRLKGGIIYYAKTLEHLEAGAAADVIDPQLAYPAELNPQHTRNLAESKFYGVNYVFDDRFGARITSDVLTACGTCGQPCDSFTNCQNDDCNVLHTQCSQCRTAYSNCCSKACEAKIKGSVKVSAENIKVDVVSANAGERSASQAVFNKPIKTHATSFNNVADAFNAYCEQYSTQETPLLAELRRETNKFDVALSRMVSGPAQGCLLSMLATVTNARTVLELGTFTGYSALCLATNMDLWELSHENLSQLNAQQLAKVRSSSRSVHTCEIEKEFADIAQKYFNRSAVGEKITLHRSNATDVIQMFRSKGQKFDMVFIDANKKHYLGYLRELMGEEGDGKSSLLNSGALIVVDNTLWKGLVLHKVDKWKSVAPNPEEFGAAVRMMKVADTMHEFNEFVAHHPNLHTLQLPMRDGFTMLRYVPQSTTAS